jgi:hypothetical protein
MPFLARFRRSPSPRPCPADRYRKPTLEWLEDRCLPSVTIQFDYSHDVNGFFNDPARRTLLEQAGQTISSQLGDTLTAISPSGSNTWSAQFDDPGTGSRISINNLNVPANTLILFVGGHPLTNGNEVGLGEFGGFQASGTTAWLDTVAARGQNGALSSPPTDFGPWGGAVAFDTHTNWYFGSDTSGLNSSETDFLTVALHELGHVFGFGTAASFAAKVSGGQFTGANSVSEYGAKVPLDSVAGHWAQGVTDRGQETVMEPILPDGTRRSFTPLDFAGLADVGWQVSGLPGQIAVAGGSQSTLVGTSFPNPILITVTDASGHPVSGVNVTVTAPSSGASATLMGAGPTNSSGQVTLTAVANQVAGTYSVTVSAASVTTTFSLTNLASKPVANLFVRGLDNQVYFAPLDASGKPQGTYSLAAHGQVQSITPATDANGNPLLFALGLDDQVYLLKFDTNSNPTGSYSLTAPGRVKSIAVDTFSGMEELFAIGMDNQVYALKLDANGNATSPYTLTTPGQIKAFSLSQAALPHLYVIGLDDQVYEQQFDGSGNHTLGYSLVGVGRVKSIAVDTFSGMEELFALGLDNQVYALKLNAAGTPQGGYALTTPGEVKGFTLSQAALPHLYVIGLDDQVYEQQFDASGNHTTGYGLVGVGRVKAIIVKTFANSEVLFGLGLDEQVYQLPLDTLGNPKGGYALTTPGRVQGLALGIRHA